MKIIAHRNETPGRPESSLAALEYSAQEGIYAVECDVRRLGDGTYAIYHDETLKRLAGVDRRLDEMTLAEVRDALRAVGREILTFDELIAGYSRRKPILLHVKERFPYPDLIGRIRAAKDMLIPGIECLDMLAAVREFVPAERLLAFMPEKTMYPAFIEGGAGIIRLWEGWLEEVTPEMVHAAGAKQVWIMCSDPVTHMDGNPASLSRFLEIGVDGALISDVKMAIEWMRAKQLDTQCVR